MARKGATKPVSSEVPLARPTTIIHAPSLTKNEVDARGPEISYAKTGNNWCFGMKARIAADVDGGVAHSLENSTVKMHESQVWDTMQHREETSVWADKWNVNTQREAAFKGPGKVCGRHMQGPQRQPAAPSRPTD